MKLTGSGNVDHYIATCPPEMQPFLEKIRAIIRKTAPEAEEVISYQMPAYKLNGILVYFAGCKNHVGFYPTGSGVEPFREKLMEYKCSKGAIQFPYNKPLPVALITEIVKFRMAENKLRAKSKK
jgi:uncharacterized protein YdhG (YjbR/CyaY superfamily)